MSDTRSLIECRLNKLLATLEEQLSNAREHERKMRDALAESESWSLAEDRAWIAAAVEEAAQMVEDAEERLAAGRRIVARTMKETPK